MMGNDVIGFLVDRKYPVLLRAIGPNDRGDGADRRLKTKQSADAYRVELQELPKDELNALYQREMRKNDEEAAVRSQREDEVRFFKQASAMADYDYWSKAAYWTLDEAVALAMGKNPEIVNLTSLAAYRAVSPFVQLYDRLRNLAARAVGVGKLFDPVLPAIFVNWAIENEIEIPEIMRESVVKGAARINLEVLSKHQAELISELKLRNEDQEAEISSLTATVLSLQEKRAETLESQVATPSSKPQSPVERDNMLKVILAMAIDVYGHDPTKARSTTVADICSALDRAGLPLSDDSVRRYLDDAERKLTKWREEQV